MRQDTKTGLYDFPAREYGIVGRWISPDPAGFAAVDPTNPQTWNRYAYVNNNPLSNNDPTGLACYPIEGGGRGSCDGADSGWTGNEFGYGVGCDPTVDPFCVFAPRTPWYGVGQGSGVNDNSEFGFGGDFSSDAGCDSDYMPCGLPAPTLWQALGLPSLSCPQWMGPLCGGINPAMDAGAANNGQSGCGRAVTLGAISVGLDIIGAIPGLGNAVSAGVAGAKVATRIAPYVNAGINYGSAAYGIGTGINDESPVGAVTAGTALGLTLADAALEGGKVIPVVGNFFSAVTGFYDSYQLGKTVAKCWGGG